MYKNVTLNTHKMAIPAVCPAADDAIIMTTSLVLKFNLLDNLLCTVCQ